MCLSILATPSRQSASGQYYNTAVKILYTRHCFRNYASILFNIASETIFLLTQKTQNEPFLFKIRRPFLHKPL